MAGILQGKKAIYALNMRAFWLYDNSRIIAAIFNAHLFSIASRLGHLVAAFVFTHINSWAQLPELQAETEHLFQHSLLPPRPS
jgi:hypothetical protein